VHSGRSSPFGGALVNLADAAEIAALPAPWPSVIGLWQKQDRLTSAIISQLRDLAAEQEREWQDIAAVRDELHTLAAALVRAGIPLDLSPTLRGVS
jgi:hypothetical protein